MEQPDAGVMAVLGIVCLIAIALILWAGGPPDDNDPGGGWR